MHDALFANQDDLRVENLERQATAAGVDRRLSALPSRQAGSRSA